jgi:methylase of polypeptide subunit release factors
MTKDADSALLDLLWLLDGRGYDFVTITPASHARVIARPGASRGHDLRDLFGWSLALPPGGIEPKVEDLLGQAGMLAEAAAGLKSRLRVSRLHGRLFLHSAYPTEAEDAVFFGPDSYRFADLIVAELTRAPLPPGAHIVDIGAGAGVGGIAAALASTDARITLTDLNSKALRLAGINARAAGVPVTVVEAATLADVADPIDLAVINPPYIIDDGNRAYRDGGGMKGGEIPLQMSRMAVERLAPGGRLILYTGAAITGGHNRLREALAELAAERDYDFRAWEIDPDVFGEELEKPAYAEVERIALMAAVVTRLM